MKLDLVSLLLNLSLVFAILVAPSTLLLSMWYKKSLGKAVFSWPKSEMVLLTIVFFIVALVLFIVGVSCFFTYFGYLDPIQFPNFDVRQFFNLGLCCLFLVAGLAVVYFGMRNMMVQLVIEKGILVNRRILPLGSSVRLLSFHEIVDYYVVPDYPNVTFTFIVAAGEVQFERQAIKVPVYLKDDFQAFVDHGMQNPEGEQSDSEFSSRRYFSEN